MPEMGGFEATAAIRALRDASAARRAADHRDDRARHERRPRALPRRRHGRIPHQAARSASAVRARRADGRRAAPPATPRRPSCRRSRSRCWRASAATASCSPRSAGCSSTMRRAISTKIRAGARRARRRGAAARRARAQGRRRELRRRGRRRAPRATLEEIGRTGEFDAHEAAWQTLSVETDRLISMLRTVCQ